MISFKTSRIQKICDSVDKDVVAEVGADHGLITKNLFCENKIKFCYLTDISSKCLDKARQNFRHEHKNKQVEFLVGDGLEPLDTIKRNKPKQVIIAGMGGNEIIKILTKNSSYTDFVLEPQKNVVELRKFLMQNNYLIKIDEIVKCKNIFYNVLKVKKTNKKHPLTKQQLLFGKTNLKKKGCDFLEYLNAKKDLCEKVLKKKNVFEKKDELIRIEKVLKTI